MPKKSIEDKYQKKTPIEHILDRPDTYIGDVKEQTDILWTFNPDTGKMIKKKVSYVPGLIKIFDELKYLDFKIMQELYRHPTFQITYVTT